MFRRITLAICLDHFSLHINEYFCRPNLQKEFKPDQSTDFNGYMCSPVKNSMFCTPVSKDEIIKIIANFKNTKSPGPDNVTPKLLKAAQNEIIDPLLHLFNFSFFAGIVPAALKMSKVVPLHKKAEKHLVSNYRPISLLNKCF